MSAEFPELQEEKLTPSERTKLDQFIKEYLLDYDLKAAAIRTGCPSAIATEMGTLWLNKPYTQRKVKDLEGNPTDEETPDVMKKRILAGLVREANYYGPGSSQSARVAALAKLASIHGMDAPSRIQQEITTEGQAVFVIPGQMTPEQWKAAAEAQQDALTTPRSETKH